MEELCQLHNIVAPTYQAVDLLPLAEFYITTQLLHTGAAHLKQLWVQPIVLSNLQATTADNSILTHSLLLAAYDDDFLVVDLPLTYLRVTGQVIVLLL